jgi:UDP-GlcNAc:undecaprenyl-phosphate GlcNAc-1-phosphate transferase
VQTQTLVLMLLSCWALALVATPLMIRLAFNNGWLDHPSDRKLHSGPVPYTGGIAVFASAILGVCLVAPWSEAVRSVAFGSGSLVALGLGVALIVALGAYDDLREIPAFLKLAGQVAIAALTWFLGFRSGVLDLPFGWVLGGEAVISFAMTVAWIVLVTNAFNLIDGLDGLAAGIGIVAALTLVILGQSYNSAVAVIASLALAGALAAFLRYNLPPARVFLGDAGAMGVGYTTAVVSLASYQRSPTAVVLVIPFVVLGLPLVDTLLAILRRTTNHVRERRHFGLRPRALARAVMSADRSHIHHILLRSGWSIRRVLFALYGLAAGLGALALWARTLTPAARWALWIGLMLGGVAVLYALERRLCEETSEADVAEAGRTERRRAAG